jgi:transposase
LLIAVIRSRQRHKRGFGSKQDQAVKQQRDAIAAAGAQLFLLPPYSPDTNPIKMALAKLKTLLRQAPERTRDGLWNRIGALLDQFTP